MKRKWPEDLLEKVYHYALMHNPGKRFYEGDILNLIWTHEIAYYKELEKIAASCNPFRIEGAISYRLMVLSKKGVLEKHLWGHYSVKN